jgi:hypothetical protein
MNGGTAGAVMNSSLLSSDPPPEFGSPRRQAFPWLEASWIRERQELHWSRIGETLWTKLQEDPASITMVESGGDSRLMAIGGSNAHAFVATADRELKQALPSIDLAISILDVPTGSSAENQESTRTLATMSGPVVAAFPSSFSGDQELSYLRDWDMEVAQASRIPDPIVDILTTGYGLTAIVRADQAGQPQAVEIFCDVQLFDGMRRREISLDQPMLSTLPGMWPFIPRGEPTTLPDTVVKIEQPTTREHRMVLTMPLNEDGTAEMRRTVRSFTGPDRELVVTIRAVRR